MKIFCIGMNYAAHNKELHGTLKKPDEPVIFLKADSSLLKDHKPFFIPDHLGRIEYETEVVVRICKLGKTGAACLGEWVPKEKFRDLNALRFHLDINGQTMQEGCTSDMLYKIDEIIAYISQYFTLKTGDILFTGTPAGVGPVHIDDHLEGYLEERKVLEFKCK